MARFTGYFEHRKPDLLHISARNDHAKSGLGISQAKHAKESF